MKIKVAESEKKAAEANAKIEYVYLDRIKVVKDVQVVVQERIRDVAVTIDSQCKVAPEAISLLNDSARNIKPGAKK